ncbi:MAG: ral secretion pathway protein [Acidobacteriaceae bacterium]|nr:ral secretion pathway protein [Acidobacteriaceae bacterium]
MMVLDYYRLEEQPFGVTPDPRYLFLTPTHKEALNSLIYGIEAGCGFVALIATPGSGKTTLIFEMLHILRDKARIVFLFQTISTPMDLVRSLLSGLGVRDLQGNLVEMQIRLRDLLTEQYRLGKRVVVVIDEAQNLDDSVLELVRMLSNFETARDKLVQIILAGQPQLADNIGSPELLQLRQRISIFARLRPFTPEETTVYILHRLRVAGYNSDMPLFTKDALALIALYSEGLPRNINNLCFNALSLGSALQQKPIDRDVIRQVIDDLDIGPRRKRASVPPKPEQRASEEILGFIPADDRTSGRWLPKIGVAAAIVLAVGLALIESQRWFGHQSAEPQPASTVTAKPDWASPTPVAPEPVGSVPAAPRSSELQDAPTPAATPSAPAPAPAPPPEDRPVPVAAPPPSLVAEQILPSMDSIGTVRVAAGQTLLGICIQKYGSCTSQLLQQIHELNPSLNNPDHIESGQNIRIPVLAAQSSAGEQPRNTSSTAESSHE